MRIIGITGSFGAGKGAIVSYLVKNGFGHFSASAFISEEVVRRGLEVNRDTLALIANELRKEYGATYIVEQLYSRAQAKGGDAIIESLRARAEVAKIKELGGFVVGVDADPRIRYERTMRRGSNKDGVTFEKWLIQEQEESNEHDPCKQDIFGSLRDSDTVIMNNGSLKELHERIGKVLATVGEV